MEHRHLDDGVPMSYVEDRGVVAIRDLNVDLEAPLLGGGRVNVHIGQVEAPNQMYRANVVWHCDPPVQSRVGPPPVG
jgi:hypothetical protein